MKKKIWVLLSIACLLVTYSKAQTQSPAIFPVMQNGKMGFMDKAGKLIVPSQYDPLDYSSFPQFSTGLINFRQNGKWGMLDGTGKVAIKPLYAQKIYFTESDYAKVKSAASWVIIDKTGNNALLDEYSWEPEIYGDILVFYTKDNPAKVNLRGIVNIRTKQKVNLQFSSVGDFKNGSAPARMEANGSYGIIDEKGNWLMKPQYSYISHAGVNNFFNAEIDAATRSWVLIDKSGKVISGPFTDFRPIYVSWDTKRNLMPVGNKASNLLGYINTAGKLVIPCKYNESLGFSEGIAIISETVTGITNPEWKALDETGKVLFTIPGCATGYIFQEGRCLVLLGEKSNVSSLKNAIIDSKGNFIIQAQAGLKLSHFKNGLCLFVNEKGMGYYDLNGKIVWEASK